MKNNSYSGWAERTGKYKHGMYGKPIYKIWISMIQRCRNINSNVYYRYGGRRIKICERWKQFKNFYKDMGDRPKGKSLDRLDNNDGYKPSNCAWRSSREQASNKRNNHFVTYKGEKRTLAQWGDKIGAHPFSIYQRLKRNWSLDRTFNQPFRKKQLKQILGD